MTFSTAATLVSLFLFSSSAVAGIVAPSCNATFSWSYNSLQQNPCLIVAYLMSTCNGGSFTVDPLGPGQNYIGPTGQDNSNLCKCSTVTYSLISACDACQGQTWITWSQFVTNCSSVEPPGQFPNPIPAGTAVPQWALLDITSGNLWDENQSNSVGDTPEIAAGTLLGPSGSNSSSTGPTSTSSPTSSATPVPVSSHSSNTGAIAGGVVGGLVAIAAAIAAVFYYRRRRQSQTPAPAVIDEQPSGFESLMDQVPRTMSGPGTVSSVPDTDPSMLRFYDPNDPTTYPTYQGSSPPPIYPRSSNDASSGPSPSSGKGPYIVGPAPNSQRLGPGYSGLPEP